MDYLDPRLTTFSGEASLKIKILKVEPRSKVEKERENETVSLPSASGLPGNDFRGFLRIDTPWLLTHDCGLSPD